MFVLKHLLDFGSHGVRLEYAVFSTLGWVPRPIQDQAIQQGEHSNKWIRLLTLGIMNQKRVYLQVKERAIFQ